MLLSGPLAEAASSRPRRGDAAPLLAWLASLVLLVALVVATYIWRDRIMTAWPPSERLYATLGLSHAAKPVTH